MLRSDDTNQSAHDVLDLSQTESEDKFDHGEARDRDRSLEKPQPREREDDARTKDPAHERKQKADDEDNKNKDEDDESEDDKDAKPGFWERVRRHKLAVIICLGAIVLGLIAGVLWYLHARHYESTDDAFVDGRPVSISPEVSGAIVSVPVTDNQIVHAGDLLAEIDPRDYQASLQQADAQIEQAKASIAGSQAQIETQKSQIDQAQKQVDSAQSALGFSKNQDYRAQTLVKDGAGTVQNAQQTASDLRSKQDSYDAAVSAKVAAERQITVLQAQLRSGQAQLAQAQAQQASAQANVSRTQLHATVDGRVTRLTAAVGAAAAPGQALMVLVPLDLWVTANFKETQLADMRVGQPVDIEIDAFGKSYPGHINSVQAGSGTAFSLLPAENATGNYVKVVQRVPVKITFDKQPGAEIGPGMSVVPNVTVR